MITIAKNKFKNIHFYNLKAEEMSFPYNFFDIITLIETFHHLSNQNLVLEKIHKILKSDGILLIAAPDIENIIIKIFVNILKKFTIEKESNFLTKVQIIKLAKSFRLENIKTYKSLGNVFILFRKTP